MTAITITDPALIERLLQEGFGEFRDPNGRVLMRFTATPYGDLPPGVASPFTEEVLTERRKDLTGRPLADILRDLQARG
jgi:hypothetical protein